MKYLITTIAAVVLVGCSESQKSTPTKEAKPVDPVAGATKPESPTVKAPDISIHDAAKDGNIEAVKQHIAAGTDVNAPGNRDIYGMGYTETPTDAARRNFHGGGHSPAPKTFQRITLIINLKKL